MTTEVLTLISQRNVPTPNGGTVPVDDGTREVFAERRSVGMKESYEAAAVGLKPEIVFVLEDALDYEGEKYAVYNDVRYRVHRNFQPKDSTTLELVLIREVNKP